MSKVLSFLGLSQIDVVISFQIVLIIYLVVRIFATIKQTKSIKGCENCECRDESKQ